MTARGVRNNNPGNIRGQFFGATGTDGAFGVYPTMDDGIRAIDAQLGRYYSGQTKGTPLQTIREMIEAWAPDNENDTAAYIADVSRSTGLAPDQRLDWADRGTRVRMAKAIIDHENGAGHGISEQQVADVLTLPRPQGLVARPTPRGADAGDIALAITNYETPLARQLSAKMGEAFWMSSVGQALANLRGGGDFGNPALNARMRDAGYAAYQPRPDAMDEAAWKASPFWRERLTWDAAMTPARARAMADIFDENEHRRWLIDHAPDSLWRGALGFAAGMLAQAPDPINYIPVFGAAARARAIARFGAVGGRALTSAGEAAVTNMAAMPVITASAERFGDDVTLTDMLLDVTLGTAFGGALGASAGAWARYRGRGAAMTPQVVEPARAALDTASSDVAAGRPVAIAPAVGEAMQRGTSTVAPRPLTVADSANIVSLTPNEIGVDAARFQFKEGGDQYGVTERLAGVDRFDERLAGAVMVWQDADGRMWIVDGHQRLGLARRAAAEGQQGVRLNALVLRAADGISDGEARAAAAFKNIAEGTGSAIDAAKVFRAAKADGFAVPPLPPRSALVRDGRDLAKLGERAFGMAVNGVVPPNYAAVIGRIIDDPELQSVAMGLLAKAKPENVQQAELIARQVLDAGTVRTKQMTLFGDEWLTESLVVERAKILDAALRRISRDKAAFRILVDEAKRIEEAGNRLARDVNVSRLTEDEQLGQIIGVLATRTGPVSDALTDAARAVKGGRSIAAAAEDFAAHVRRRLAEGMDMGLRGGGDGRGDAGDAGRNAGDPAPEPVDPAIGEAERTIGTGEPEMAERAEELGLFGDALDAEEQAAFDRLVDEGRIDAEDAAAVREAAEAADRADGYAAAIEEAQLCMFGGV